MRSGYIRNDLNEEMEILRTQTCVLVLGTHRSGTSVLTHIISLLGASLPENILGANDTNPTGHWEPSRLVKLHDEMLMETGSQWDDWRAFDFSQLSLARQEHYKTQITRIIREEYGSASIFVLKEPRISRFVGLYIEILRSLNIEIRIVLTNRNPLAVIASLQTRTGMTFGFASLIWLRHELDGEHTSRSHPRVFVSYETLLQDWHPIIDKVASVDSKLSLRTKKEKRAIERFLSPQFRHHSASVSDLVDDERICEWIKGSYKALKLLEADPDDLSAIASLDCIRTQFNTTSKIFGEASFPEFFARRQAITESHAIDNRVLSDALADANTQLEYTKSQLQDKLTEVERNNEHAELMLDNIRKVQNEIFLITKSKTYILARVFQKIYSTLVFWK
ncbi:hypothetical protein D3C80_597800 [compost metagenome]